MAVSLVAVLLAVFIPQFAKDLRLSKVSEATNELSRIEARALSYYQQNHTPSPSDSKNALRETRRRCLPEPAGPTPAEASKTPVEVVFQDEATDGSITWAAFGYEPQGPIRFRYTFTPVAATCGARGAELWAVRAEGDLDGDGKHSVFERVNGVREDGTVGPVGTFHVLDATE